MRYPARCLLPECFSRARLSRRLRASARGAGGAAESHALHRDVRPAGIRAAARRLGAAGGQRPGACVAAAHRPGTAHGGRRARVATAAPSGVGVNGSRRHRTRDHFLAVVAGHRRLVDLVADRLVPGLCTPGLSGDRSGARPCRNRAVRVSDGRRLVLFARRPDLSIECSVCGRAARGASARAQRRPRGAHALDGRASRNGDRRPRPRAARDGAPIRARDPAALPGDPVRAGPCGKDRLVPL